MNMKCKNCGKTDGQHNAWTQECPKGRKQKIGYSSYGPEKFEPMPKIKVGDIVKWQSQANGSIKVKVAKVIAVVPANSDATPLVPVGYKTKNFGFGRTRNHESYLVAAIEQVYWPRVKHLQVLHKHR